MAIVAVYADLTRGKGHFNALSGLIATALSLGGVIGPLCSGFIVERLGFVPAFNAFAVIAAIAAGLFLFAMPETRVDEAKTLPRLAILCPCRFEVRKVVNE